MSATDETTQRDTEAAERPFLVREFNAEVSDVRGRTIEALCVPYDKPTVVCDNPSDGPYREMFAKGAFSRAVKAPFRVWLNFEHKPGFQNVIGNGVSFEERADGLYGELDVDEGTDGDKALRFVHKNVLRSLSVQFKPMTRDRQNDQGIVVRTSVHLDAVALCRQGAYEDAQVLAVRTDPVLPEEFSPLPIDSEFVARCRRLGIQLPQRYHQAHPAETDTPAGAGTSEDGTRPTQETTSSEV